MEAKSCNSKPLRKGDTAHEQNKVPRGYRIHTYLTAAGHDVGGTHLLSPLALCRGPLGDG